MVVVVVGGGGGGDYGDNNVDGDGVKMMLKILMIIK